MTQPPMTIPARALFWLIAAFALLIVPQWERLPLWLLASCAALAGWRWLAQTGRIRLPGRWLRVLIMLALTACYIATVGGQFTVDTASSFFVLAVGLKWLETRQSRDFYVLFFILVYLAAINFLFQQAIGWAVVNLAGVLLLLFGLQVLNAPDLSARSLAGGRRLALMLLKTLPIVVLLFVFFPRMEPLWTVPMVSGQSRTGISDTMTPGQISDLAQSSQRAFRVSFGGVIPPHRELYWRGLILDQFDGETWNQHQAEPFQAPAPVALDGGVGPLKSADYSVLLEPTNQRWAFSLRPSVALSGNIAPAGQGLFRFQRPADTAVRYRLSRLDTRSSSSTTLTAGERHRYLQLPPDSNPRATAFARQLTRQTDSPGEFIKAVLARFRQQSYFYTLRPPSMPADSVDALLFDVKRGFCAHYASATAFLLRRANIPARIVIGYQGGSQGLNDQYLIVRQYDAHAWVEAWIDGQGWIRVDPTAAISPERIELGLRAAVADEGSFLENSWASPERYGNVAAIQWVTLQLDRINYQWQRWVVGYQGQSQLDLMSRMPGHLSLRDLGYVTAGLMAVALLVAGVFSAWHQRGQWPRDPWRRLFDRGVQLIRHSGVAVYPGDTPDVIAQRASQRYPDAEKELTGFARLANNHYYGSRATELSPQKSRQDLIRLKNRLVQLRRALRQARSSRKSRPDR